ncbi:nucleotide sugar dehydrogenase [Gudongella sp. SC589]|jgi:UDP-N-acetyl-D-mannosaminuronic acid dehydrogenase|uniref:nucleotide sugar dehydrogenase n=1 Tax=Gudongella sp. SC589 TaxID=3385990 RepID=UPI003904DAE4
MKDKRVTIVGLGYIGLPTAAVMARAGMDVLGYDLNKRVINALNEGEIIIEEPGLSDLVNEMVSAGRLRGISSLEESDVFIIAVPTPITEDKKADMSYVESAAEEIAPHLKPGNIVVLESTSPPGATEEMVAPILARSGLKIGEEIFVAHSPERVLPGKIIQELVQNDRIIGGINPESTEAVKEIYRTFVKGEIYTTDSKTAEMCKLMENTFRDVNIALANELAILAENMGIDAWEVIRFANKHPRVNLHQPGPGVGGHCIAVDPWFVIENHPEGRLIRQARDINDGMPDKVLHRILQLVQDEEAKVAILGVTYKPDVDDTRESPILKLVDGLLQRTKLQVAIHDPHVDREVFPYSGRLYDKIEDTVKDADLIVLGVNHFEYSTLDFSELGKLMKSKKVYDTRNYLNQKELAQGGFQVTVLGRGN